MRTSWPRSLATADLAREFGREVRNIVSSEAYQAIYPTRLAQDSKAANKWNTSEGGAWYSVGIGGDILGRGAHIALIDDPYGSMKDARSPVMREAVWSWFSGSLYNRMEPDGAIVIIGHRMHEDDLQGRLEERMRAHEEYADQWTIVELPAVAGEDDLLGRAPGEALWPEHFSLPRLERIRANSLARDWSALYQQRPTPDEGELFAVERIVTRDHTSDVGHRQRTHRVRIRRDERVERGEIDRLMLRMPPRHGKFELASKSFPSYVRLAKTATPPWAPIAFGRLHHEPLRPRLGGCELALQALVLRLQGLDVGFEDV